MGQNISSVLLSIINPIAEKTTRTLVIRHDEIGKEERAEFPSGDDLQEFP